MTLSWMALDAVLAGKLEFHYSRTGINGEGQDLSLSPARGLAAIAVKHQVYYSPCA